MIDFTECRSVGRGAQGCLPRPGAMRPCRLRSAPLDVLRLDRDEMYRQEGYQWTSGLFDN